MRISGRSFVELCGGERAFLFPLLLQFGFGGLGLGGFFGLFGLGRLGFGLFAGRGSVAVGRLVGVELEGLCFGSLSRLSSS